jgi:hypothetical protein
MGRRLRGLFNEAGFQRVEAFADYISYGTPDRTMAFAHDRAMECRDEEWRTTVTRHGIASAEELTHLAAYWEECRSLTSTGFAGPVNAGVPKIIPVPATGELYPQS